MSDLPWLWSACTSVIGVDSDCFGCFEDTKTVRRTKEAPTGPLLALRVNYVLGEDSPGARFGPFGVGDDIAITNIVECKGLDPLRWRQQQASSSRGGAASLWPRDGSRFADEQRFCRAEVMVSDGNGGFEKMWCLLASATAALNRTMEKAKVVVEDSLAAASIAGAFNAQTARLHGAEEGGQHDAESVVGVRVCMPVACFVLGGSAMEVAQPGQAIVIYPYPYASVLKFCFDGQEDFNELPQAFFHYSTWFSGGREVVADLQGMEDEDGDILILDPVILRPEPVGVTDLLGTLVQTSRTENGGAESETLDRQRFNAWHPKCGQLCKAFDPARRSALCRRQCGLQMPSCGVGGA